MDTQTQIFFFISSIGFVVLWILTGIFLFYLIRAMQSLSRILDKAEKSIDQVGDFTKEIAEEIKESKIFSFLFRKKKKGRRV